MAVSTSPAEAMPIIAISQPRLAIIATMRWAMKPGESLIRVTLAPVRARIAAAASRTSSSAPVVEETFVDDLARREVHVDAGEVHQLERAHAEATTVAHHSVDLARRGAALLVEAQALGADGGAAEIDQEARRVANHHRNARLALAQRRHGVDHPGGGVGGADHLDELHQGHGIEIVHAADTVAVLQ